MNSSSDRLLVLMQNKLTARVSALEEEERNELLSLFQKEKEAQLQEFVTNLEIELVHLQISNVEQIQRDLQIDIIGPQQVMNAKPKWEYAYANPSAQNPQNTDTKIEIDTITVPKDIPVELRLDPGDWVRILDKLESRSESGYVIGELCLCKCELCPGSYRIEGLNYGSILKNSLSYPNSYASGVSERYLDALKKKKTESLQRQATKFNLEQQLDQHSSTKTDKTDDKKNERKNEKEGEKKDEKQQSINPTESTISSNIIDELFDRCCTLSVIDFQTFQNLNSSLENLRTRQTQLRKQHQYFHQRTIEYQMEIQQERDKWRMKKQSLYSDHQQAMKHYQQNTLIGACQRSDLKQVESLLKPFTNRSELITYVNVIDENTGNVALHVACENGDINIVNRLLEAGASPLMRDKATEDSAVHVAARHDHIHILEALLQFWIREFELKQQNGRIDNRDTTTSTTNGGKSIPRRGTGSNLESNTNSTNSNNNLPSNRRGSANSTDGSNTRISSDGGTTTIGIFGFSNWFNRLQINSRDKTATNTTDTTGDTATTTTKSAPKLPVSRARTRNERIHELVNVNGFQGRTPLDSAAHYRQISTAKWLIDHFALVNHQEQTQQRTPLHSACRQGDVAMCRLLLEYGKTPEQRANPFMVNGNGETPLAVALFYERIHCVKYFVEEKGIWLDHPQLVKLLEFAKRHKHRNLVLLVQSVVRQQQMLLDPFLSILNNHEAPHHPHHAKSGSGSNNNGKAESIGNNVNGSVLAPAANSNTKAT